MENLYIVKEVDNLHNATIIKNETGESFLIHDKSGLLKINDKVTFIGSDIKIYHDEKHQKRIQELTKKRL